MCCGAGAAPKPERVFFAPGTYFVLDNPRDDVLNWENYGMGRCAWRVPAHFILRRSRARQEAQSGGSCNTPNVHSPTPGPPAGRSRPDPTSAEAGLNRPLLPCPARLRPAEPGSTPLSSTGKWSDPLGPRFRAHWPWTRKEVEARDAQARGVPISGPRYREAHASCRRRLAAPASQTGRSDLLSRGRGPAVGCRFASSGGRRGDVSSTRVTKGVSMQSS
jgi:hypothetical protein